MRNEHVRTEYDPVSALDVFMFIVFIAGCLLTVWGAKAGVDRAAMSSVNNDLLRLVNLWPFFLFFSATWVVATTARVKFVLKKIKYKFPVLDM